MDSPLHHTAEEANTPPDRPSWGALFIRWVDGVAGLVLLAAGGFALSESLRPFRLGSFLISLALVLTGLLDLRRWIFEGQGADRTRRVVFVPRWKILLWLPVLGLLLTGALLSWLGY